MGYFAHLYTVELNADDEIVSSQTHVYGNEIAPVAYFGWGPGERPAGLHSYAGGTVHSDADLKLLPGYPLRNTIGDDPNNALVEANFRPRQSDDPVLFHFVLPKRFVPRRSLEPLEQPSRPFVYAEDDRVIATYAAAGPSVVRFWISRLQAQESLRNYDIEKLLHPEEDRRLNVGIEFNFGVFKLKLGKGAA